MNHKTRVRFFSFLSLTILSFTSCRLYAEDWRPRSQQYQVREARQDCSVIKAVLFSTQQTLDRKSFDLKELTKSTKSLYQSVKDCQKKNGILSSDSLDTNSKTAEVCSEAFDFWVLEGAHLMVVEEDIEKLQEDLGVLKSEVGRKCLPTLEAELK